MLEEKRTKLILNILKIKENILDQKTNKKGAKIKLYKDYLYAN